MHLCIQILHIMLTFNSVLNICWGKAQVKTNQFNSILHHNLMWYIYYTFAGTLKCPIFLEGKLTQQLHQERSRHIMRHSWYSVIVIPDTLELASDLYSKGVVSRSLRNKLRALGLSSDEKNILLLNEVEGQISSNPNVFQTFVTSLQSIVPLEEMGKKLIESYCKYCWYQDCCIYLNYTVELLYNCHYWEPTFCPLYRGVFLVGVVLHNRAVEHNMAVFSKLYFAVRWQGKLSRG